MCCEVGLKAASMVYNLIGVLQCCSWFSKEISIDVCRFIYAVVDHGWQEEKVNHLYNVEALLRTSTQ